VINIIMPHCILIKTEFVWNPWKVDSRMISRHQLIITIIIKKRPIIKEFIFKLWNHLAIPLVIKRALREPINGHGLNSTKWNGDWVIIFFYQGKFRCVDKGLGKRVDK
jgi:hypothetical protein